MEIFEKNFLKILLIAIMILFFDMKIDYASTISGRTYEVKDDGSEIDISDVIVEIYNEDEVKLDGLTVLSKDGKYEITGIDEPGKYYIEFSCANLKHDDSAVKMSDLNSYDENKVAQVKNILKYNLQDYELNYDDYISPEVKLSDTEMQATHDTFFTDIDYNRSVIFNALDMDFSDITNREEDFKKFKKYAEILSNNASLTGQSVDYFLLTGEDDDIVVGPDLVLQSRPEFNIRQTLNITGMRVKQQDGSVSVLKTGAMESEEPLLEYQEAKLLHGSSLELQYTLNIENMANDNTNVCNSFSFLCYLPKGFSYNDNMEFIGDGINYLNNETELKVGQGQNVNFIQITKDNIKNFNTYYQIDDADSTKELENTELYNQVVNEGKNVLLIQVILDEPLTNEGEFITLQFMASKLLNGLDDDQYEGDVEVFKYSNSKCRRMQKIDDAKTFIAGDGDKNQGDISKAINCAIIIPPTGKDMRTIKIYFVISVLIIVMIFIILKIKKKI